MAREETSAPSEIIRPRWNVLSLVICCSLLGLVLWEIFLRSPVLDLIHRSLDNYAADDEILFRALDTDRNGYLSPNEWIPYFQQCSAGQEGKGTLSLPEQEKNDSAFYVEDNEEVITIQALFKSIRLETLKKDVSSFSKMDPGALRGLLSWTRPHLELQSFATRQFFVFLPPGDKPVSPGDTWWVVAPQQGSSGLMSSARYHPPEPSKHAQLLSALFGMLHPRPFLVTRFPPQGTLAVLRAANQSLLDIVFRAHVEFQLNEAPDYPFWLTPAQFRGRLIIDRTSLAIRYFSSEVPTSRKLNVDMEWLNGPDERENMEVDIAFAPLMSIKSTGPSVRVNLTETKGTWSFPATEAKEYEKSINSLSWANEISMDQAVMQLESHMYTFMKVPYHNLTEAFSRATILKRPIHAVLLWGSLDDQSC